MNASIFLNICLTNIYQYLFPKFILFENLYYICIMILYLWISFGSSYEMTNYFLIMRVIYHCIIVMLFYLMP